MKRYYEKRRNDNLVKNYFRILLRILYEREKEKIIYPLISLKFIECRI